MLVRNFFLTSLFIFSILTSNLFSQIDYSFPNRVKYTSDEAYDYFALASDRYDNGSYNDAILLWSDLLYSYQADSNYSDLVSALYNIGLSYTELKNRTMADHYYRLAAKICAYYAVETKIPLVYKKLIDIYYSIGLVKTAQDFLNTAKDSAPGLGDEDFTSFIAEYEKLITDSLAFVNQRLQENLAKEKSLNGNELLISKISSAKCYIALENLEKTKKYLDDALSLCLSLNSTDEIQRILIWYQRFYLLSKNNEQKTPITYEPSETTKDYYFQILELAYTGEDECLAIISGGKDRGITLKSAGVVVGTNLDSIRDHGGVYIAEVTVQEIYDFNTLVKIKLKKTGETKDFVFLNDFVRLNVYPQKNIYQGAFSDLVSVQIYPFNSYFGEMFLDQSVIFEFYSEEIEMLLAKSMISILQNAHEKAKAYINEYPALNDVITNGRHRNKKIIDVLNESNEVDILSSLYYVAEYPKSYIGKKTDFIEYYLSWLMGNCLIGSSAMEFQLRKAKDESEVKKIAEDNLFIIKNYTILDGVADIIFKNASNKNFEEPIRQMEKVLLAALHSKVESEIANVYFALGRLLRYSKEYEKSAQYSISSAEYFKKIDKKYSVSAAYYNAALSYEDIEKYEDAIALYKQALTLKIEVQNETPDDYYRRSIAETYYQLGLVYGKNNDFENGIINLNASAKYYDSLKTDEDLKDKVYSLKAAANQLKKSKRFAEAEKIFLDLIKIVKDKLQTADVYHDFALVYQDWDKLEESIVQADISLKIKEELLAENKSDDLYEKMGSTLWGKAWSLRYLNKFNEAKEVYKLSAVYYDSSSSEDAKRSKATVLKNSGEIFKAQGNYKPAIELYEQSLVVARSVNYAEKIGDLLDDIAYSYFELAEYNKAIEIYTEAYNHHLGRGSKYDAGYSMSNIGQAYWNQGKYNESVEAHKTAIKLREEIKSEKGLAYSWSKLAAVYKESGDPKNAIEAFEKAWTFAENVDDTSSKADIYKDIGDLYKSLKDYTKAIEYHQKVIDLRILLKNKIDIGDAIHNIGHTYYEAARFDEADKAWTESYNLSIQTGDKVTQLYSMVNLGLLKFEKRRNYDSAKVIFDASLKLAQELESVGNIAFVYTMYARLYNDKGDIEKAYHYFDEALNIYRETGEKAREAFILIDLGYLQISKGDFEKALKYFSDARVLSEAINDRARVANSDFGFADIAVLQGDLKKARDIYNSLMKVFDEIKNPWGIAGVYISLGNLANQIGEYANAIEQYRLADSVYKSLNDEVGQATPLNNMGNVYYWQGDNETALGYFQKALAILEKFKIENEFYAIVRSNIGEIYLMMKKYDDSRKWLTDALTLAKKVESNRLLTSIYSNFSRLEIDQKNYDEALKNSQLAYDWAKKIGEKDRITETAGVLGKVFYLKQDYNSALKYLDESISLSKQIGTTRFLYQPLYTSALVSKSQNNIDKSIEYLRDAVNTVEFIRSKLVGGDKASKIFSSGEEKVQIYEMLVSLFFQKGMTDSALFYLERSNNEGLRQSFGSKQFTPQDEKQKDIIDQEKDLKIKKELAENELIKEQSKPVEQQNKDKINKLLEIKKIAENEYLNFINNTVKQFPELADYFKSSVNPKTFMRNKNLIPDDVAVLAYLMGSNQLYIFVATKKSVTAKVVEIGRDNLEKKVVQFYRYLKDSQIPTAVGNIDPKTFKPTNAEMDLEYETQIQPYLKVSNELYAALIEPVQEELQGKKILSIIPYGKLYYVPFEVLIKNSNQDFGGFLGDDFDCFYTSSLDVFSAICDAQDGAMKLVAFGNPDNTLENAEKEAKSLKSIYSDAVVYASKEATLDKVHEIAAPFNAIHFATHGNMDYTDPAKSYLTMAPKPGEKEGKLTIEDINTLSNLQCFNLVTLSACKTAVSDELIQGWYVNPANAFFEVGVQTVIASLWKVDDESTFELMKLFYGNLKTMNKIEALRNAKKTLSQNPKFAFPYYWAGFILVGNYE